MASLSDGDLLNLSLDQILDSDFLLQAAISVAPEAGEHAGWGRLSAPTTAIFPLTTHL